MPPSIPEAPAEPDPDGAEDWDPTDFPAEISGIVDERVTLEFKQPRGDRNTFEKLVIDGKSVLGGRTHLAQLIAQHDPQPGDGISIRAFGKNGRGKFLYSMAVDKSDRLSSVA